MESNNNEIAEMLDEDLEPVLNESLEEDSRIKKEVAEEEDQGYIKMDYSLESPQDRVKKVEEIIANTPQSRLTPRYLEKLSDYIIFAMDKEERKKKYILTDNHMVTVNSRETSFEGLVGRLENGEDGIYNMIANDKNIIFKPKVEITEKDLAEIPALRELRAAIADMEAQAKNARGKKAFLLKKAIIEARQDQYVIKNSYRQPIYCVNPIKGITKLDLTEHITIKDDVITTDGIISLLIPEHICALLCNYEKLKIASWDKLQSDIKWLMEDLDNLIRDTLKDDYPLYYDIVQLKIAGEQNITIQKYLEKVYGIKHSVEYISSLWRNKIPELLAKQEQENWIIWHYTEEEIGKWKKCSRCGQIKLANNRFFSKNKTSKDGFYSICKCCRNKKK